MQFTVSEDSQTYIYRNEVDEVQYIVQYRGQKKQLYSPLFEQEGVMQRGLGSQRKVLYNLKAILTHSDVRTPIILAPNEVLAQQLIDRGCVATTCLSGLKYWSFEYNGPFHNKRVLLVYHDYEDSGVAEASKRLKKVTGNLWSCRLPEGLCQFSYQDLMAYFEDEEMRMEVSNVQEIEFTHYAYYKGGEEISHPLATIENIDILLEHYNIRARYNLLKSEKEFHISDIKLGVENRLECSYVFIESLANRHKIPTYGLLGQLLFLANRDCYSPVIEWIESKPWDGVSRWCEMVETIQCDNDVAKELYLRKWFNGALKMAYNDGYVEHHGVLVLRQHRQGRGKTSWFASLCGEHNKEFCRKGASINPENKDDVILFNSFWITELGELETTLAHARGKLKAFITKSVDKIRRPYAREETSFVRRGVLGATVNESQFLDDPSGSRRFWVLNVSDINYQHGIDMQQLWAEVKVRVDGGETNWLDEGEIIFVNELNEEFELSDPIHDLLAERLNWVVYPDVYELKTATSLLMDLGIEHPTKAEAKSCGEFLAKRGCKNISKKINGKPLYVREVPPKI